MDRVGVQESEQKPLFARIETTESAMQIGPIIKEAILLLWIRRATFLAAARSPRSINDVALPW